MPAAPAGTVVISCPTPDDGTLSVTVAWDPDTGAFAADAFTCSGAESAAGQLCIGDVRGSYYFTVKAGGVITNTQLGAAGIIRRSQVRSVSLALV